MSSLSNFAIVASHKFSTHYVLLPSDAPEKKNPEVLSSTVVGTERRRGCGDDQKKREGGQRQTGSGDSDRERESADSWDGSRGASIDPGEWADSHFTASAVTPALGYGTEPYIPSGQGDLDPIRFCLCATGARKVMHLRAVDDKRYFSPQLLASVGARRSRKCMSFKLVKSNWSNKDFLLCTLTLQLDGPKYPYWPFK